MPLERERARENKAAIARTRQAAQRSGREGPRQQLRSQRVGRAELALVSSYLRALGRLGEVPLPEPYPEMPH